VRGVVRINGCWLPLPQARLAAIYANVSTGTHEGLNARKEQAHGELLLDILKFALVGMLGFMPLAVIHWSDRHPRLRVTQVNQAMTSLGMLKASIMVMLSDWSSHLPLV